GAPARRAHGRRGCGAASPARGPARPVAAVAPARARQGSATRASPRPAGGLVDATFRARRATHARLAARPRPYRSGARSVSGDWTRGRCAQRSGPAAGLAGARDRRFASLTSAAMRPRRVTYASLGLFGLLLAGLLVTTGVTAWRAAHAERTAREAVAKGLDHLASVAAWELSRRAAGELDRVVRM